MDDILAFDIGGTMIKYGLYTTTGEKIWIKKTSTDAEKGARFVIENIISIIESVKKKQNIQGVAISTAGVVDIERGCILTASENIPQYEGFQIKKMIEQHCMIPVEVENDVNCAGLAETQEDVSFILTIGTGIGGCFLQNGKVYHGALYSAGEIGYFPMGEHIFETLASTRALVKRVNQRLGLEKAKQIDGKQIFDLMQEGNSICLEEIDKMTYYLAQGIAMILYCFNPQEIIIGGAIAKQEHILLSKIMTNLEDIFRLPKILENTNIRVARYGNEAGLIGAIVHFNKMQKYRACTQS